MSAATVFDPYYEWLSIPPEDQPANFYRLLGVKLFEENIKVIESAADRQMTHVRSFAGGPRAAISQRILNELSGARTMLLEPGRKSAYDSMLRAADSLAKQPTAPPPPKAEPPASKGSTLSNYEVLQLLSQSNLGQHYKARRKSDGLIVALHVAPKELAQNEEFCKRLKREFEITQLVQHPNVVASYELGEIQGRPFLALEYIGGADLSKVVAQHGALAVPAAVELTKRIAEGLAALHKKGVVHRNLKPEHILINVHGNLKIAGLTLALEEDASAFLAGRDINITQAGAVLGSPEYLPPEQAADSHAVDGRADLYALGCVLHFLLLGRPPYTGKNTMQILQGHRNGPIPSLTAERAEVPQWLDALFQKLLAKRPNDRPASAPVVVKALAAGEDGAGGWNLPLLVVSGVAVAVILFLAALVAFSWK